MILKEKLFLANCDSVRKLNEQEVRARFMAGVLFADGVVLSPNLLIDNPWLINVLKDKSIKRWFSRDQHNESKLVIRGFALESNLSFEDYFSGRDDTFVVSRFGGVHKNQLTQSQQSEMLTDLREIDTVLKDYTPHISSLELKEGALSEQIHERLLAPVPASQVEIDHRQKLEHQAVLAQVEQSGCVLGSRSDWYNALYRLDIAQEQRERFRLEVVDASYNGLFVGECEAFVMDRIVGLSQLPGWLLKTGVTVGSHREELAMLKAGYDLFSFISTLGSEELAKVIADKALEYAEDKAKSKGASWCERRNWFGLYPKLTNFMGVELK